MPVASGRKFFDPARYAREKAIKLNLSPPRLGPKATPLPPVIIDMQGFHRSTALRSASPIGSEASSAKVMGFTGGRRR